MLQWDSSRSTLTKMTRSMSRPPRQLECNSMVSLIRRCLTFTIPFLAVDMALTQSLLRHLQEPRLTRQEERISSREFLINRIFFHLRLSLAKHPIPSRRFRPSFTTRRHLSLRLSRLVWDPVIGNSLERMQASTLSMDCSCHIIIGQEMLFASASVRLTPTHPLTPHRIIVQSTE